MPSSSYLTRAASPRTTPQSEPIPGRGQVPNNAGGHAWAIGPMERLRRFLILGSEGGTYYATERKLTKGNIDAVRVALDEHGVEAVEAIVSISTGGRAIKNDPALYALAMASAHPSDPVRRAALDAIPAVARTGTHLFHFAEFAETQRGWGRGLKRGVAAWYEREDVQRIAYQLTKYRQRDGYTHADLLRLTHPGSPTAAHRALYAWVAADLAPLQNRPKAPGERIPQKPLPDGLPLRRTEHGVAADDDRLKAIEAFSRAQRSDSPGETAELIGEYGSLIPREAILTDHLASAEVWDALLHAGMPMTAMIRNLANMTRIGVVKPMSAAAKLVTEMLADENKIRRARVHPFAVLLALSTYRAGRTERFGGNTWNPVREVVDALDGAFYLAFANVEPTGKRYVLGLDCSHSMDTTFSGSPLTCMTAAAAMALITERVEPSNVAIAFHDKPIPIPLSSRQRLDDAMGVLPRSFGRTDCALPMLWALDQGIEADVFVIYTDNETWSGAVHPVQALNLYRQETGIPARMVVAGMTSDGFSIADPNDSGMFDVVGFDADAPGFIADFSAGRL